MYLYARCFELGTGLEASPSEAAEWYRRAAEAGNRPAQEWCRQHQVKYDSEPPGGAMPAQIIGFTGEDAI